MGTASADGYGVAGVTQTTYGVFGEALNSSAAGEGVYGYAGGSGYGVDGEAATATGVLAATNGGDSTQALRVEAPNGADMINATGEPSIGTNNYYFTVDRTGNVFISGVIYTGGKCGGGGSPVQLVQSYGATSSTPTLEDNGEARLNGGAAYVRLDPALARAIDPRQGHLVTLTPEGETRGLYVQARSIAGFTVRENLDGRSNAAFAYRIVARPYGVRGARLPLISMGLRSHRAPRPILRHPLVPR